MGDEEPQIIASRLNPNDFMAEDCIPLIEAATKLPGDKKHEGKGQEKAKKWREILFRKRILMNSR